MTERRIDGTIRRLGAAALLALAPFLLTTGLETHLGHAAGAAETTIFADAEHAGQAAHWEAAETVRLRRCNDCLLPGQLLHLPPSAVAGHLDAPDGWAAVAATIDLPREPASRAHRPRAPPRSALP